MQILKEKDLTIEQNFIILDFYKDCLLKANNEEQKNSIMKMIKKKENILEKIIIN